MRVLRILLAAAATALGSSCRARLQETAMGYLLVEARPASGAVGADDLEPAPPGERRYLITAGDGAGGHLVRRREPTDRFGAAWVEHEDDLRSAYLRPDADGNALLVAVVSHRDGTVSLFDPPLVVAWKRLEAGPPKSQEVAMLVLDLADPARQRESGTATRTIEYVRDQRLRLPHGEGDLDARRVVVDFEADLRLANVRTMTILYVVPGLGPVVEERLEVIEVLGLPARLTRQTLVLAEPLGPIPPGDRSSRQDRAETATSDDR